MNKIDKIFFKVTFASLLITNIQANEIIVSENFLEHKNCKNIQKIEFSSYVNSKQTMFKILKDEVQKLKGNVAINTLYQINMFDKRTISAIAATCDIEKSPELFAKSSSMIDKDENYLSNDYKEDNIFTKISILTEFVNINKENISYSVSETKQNFGIGFKVGKEENNYRYYASLSMAVGNNLLLGTDYIYKISPKTNLLLGASFGMGNYQIDDQETMNGLIYGLQGSLEYKKYEFALSYLNANIKQRAENTNFNLNNIIKAEFSYRF